EKVSVLKLEKAEVRTQLQVGLSEKAMLQLRRVQEVLSQKSRRPVSLEECVEKMGELYLEKHDPLKKAKRQKIRGKLLDRAAAKIENDMSARKIVPGHDRRRKPLGASIKHRVFLKYKGQCGHLNHSGKACSSKQFLEIHHKIPVSRGGSNDVDN